MGTRMRLWDAAPKYVAPGYGTGMQLWDSALGFGTRTSTGMWLWDMALGYGTRMRHQNTAPGYGSGM